MGNRQPRAETFDELSRRIEELFGLLPADANPAAEDLLNLIHDLRRHQTELENRIAELTQDRGEPRAGHDRFSSLYNLAPCGYITLDAEAAIKRINVAGERLLGVERKDVGDRGLESFLAPESRPACRAALQRAIASGEQQRVELKLQRAEAASLWVLADIQADPDHKGKPPESRLTLVDITEKKRVEMDLLLQSRISRIFLTVPDEDMYGHVLEVLKEVFDSRYGFFGYIDRQGALVCPSMTRDIWSKCQIPDKDVVFPRETWGGLWGRSLTGKEALLSNGGLDLPEGHVQFQRAMASAIVNRGELVGQIALGGRALDYTEEDRDSLARISDLIAPILASRLEAARLKEDRRQAQERLIEAKQKAEKANRAKSDFLAKMSHEIRTPLNSVLGMHRLVLSGSLPAKQRERIQVAKGSAESLLWLMSDLLDLSRIEAGRFALHEKEFRPRRLLNNVLKEMEVLASEKSLDLQASVDENLPAILVGDPHRLKQILINLISNAVKFTAQGRIALEARVLDLRPAGDDQLMRASVRFAVRDTGRGIPPENLETVFNSYEQGSPAELSVEKGTGLGLAICNKLVQQMGGRIWVESDLGKGSSFFLQIPFETDGEITEETELEPYPDVESWNELPCLRILLVEDQRMNQIFTVDLLSSNGHRVEVAEDGRQALDALSRKSYDLVLMDIRMPVLDGIETTRRIRTSDPLIIKPDVPIIGLSAHAPTEEELERFHSAGFDDYLVKPVSFEKLFNAIRRASAIRSPRRDDPV